MGLCWFPLEAGKPGRTMAKKLYAGCLCDVTALACQALGLGQSQDLSHADSLMSLAAWLGARLGDGIVLLPLQDEDKETFYMLYVRVEGRFLAAYTDSLYGSFEEGKRRVSEVLELCRGISQSHKGSLPSVFMAKDIAQSLDYLQGLPPPSFLERLWGSFRVCTGRLPPQGLCQRLVRFCACHALFLFLFFGLAGGLGFLWPFWQTDVNPQSPQAEPARPRPMRKEPWKSGIAPEMLPQLLTAFDAQPLRYHGWRLTGFEVDMTGLKAGDPLPLLLTYGASKASEYQGLAESDRILEGGKVLVRSLTVNPAHVGSAGRNARQASMSTEREALERALLTLQQKLHIAGQLRFEEKHASERVSPWQTGHLTLQGLSSAHFPELVEELRHFPTLVLKKLRYAHGKYRLEACLYAVRHVDLPMGIQERRW